MVYLLHVLVELLLWDLLLLREPTRLLEELESAGRDGGNDLQRTQPTSGPWAQSLSQPPSPSATLPVLSPSLSTDLLT